MDIVSGGGGYSNNGGWNPTPASYSMVSLIEREPGMRVGGKPKELKELSFKRNSGQRVTPKMMQAELDKL